jgi:hypothetical protein
MQQAVRLVEREWFEALFAIDVTLEGQEWWDDSYYSVRNAEWERFAALLAGSDLDDQEWGTLTLAAEELDGIIRLRGKRGGENPHGRDYPRIVGAGRAISDGIAALDRSQGKPVTREWDPPHWYEKKRLDWIKRHDEAVERGETPPAFFEEGAIT